MKQAVSASILFGRQSQNKEREGWEGEKGKGKKPTWESLPQRELGFIPAGSSRQWSGAHLRVVPPQRTDVGGRICQLPLVVREGLLPRSKHLHISSLSSDGPHMLLQPKTLYRSWWKLCCGRRRAPTALLQLFCRFHLFPHLVVLKFLGVSYTLYLLEAKKIFQFHILSVSVGVTLILFHPVIWLTLSMFPYKMYIGISSSWKIKYHLTQRCPNSLEN